MEEILASLGEKEKQGLKNIVNAMGTERERVLVLCADDQKTIHKLSDFLPKL